MAAPSAPPAVAPAVAGPPGASLLRTEHAFTLPFGYVDERGTLHRQGVMRLATALDEVESLADPRVQTNQSYWPIVLLSRVLVRLGDLRPVPPTVVGGLFASDFGYLQDLYVRLNSAGPDLVETQCPSCGDRFTLDLSAE